jgi:hypothetical protein
MAPAPPTTLSSLMRCFQGVVPAFVGTCSRDGWPNVTYLSQVHYVDEKHVALSCQFFNKTRRNVGENPYASVHVYDPTTLESYELELRFDHGETSGPLFDRMAARIQAIASHTGMSGVFKLLSADVYEVLSLRAMPEFLAECPGDEAAPEPELPHAWRGELRALQTVSERLSRAHDLDELLSSLLAVLEEELGFRHAMVLLLDEAGEKVYAVASRGYGESGIGGEVALGEGLIGTVAQRRTTLRVSAVDAELRYGRAIRTAAQTSTPARRAAPEIPLPGLPDAQSCLAIPLVSRDELVGVLAVESPTPLGFDEWHEAFLDVVGSQVALAIENVRLDADDDGPDSEAPTPSQALAAQGARSHSFVLYKNDDCIFVDGEYLIRNVPARILWKILRAHASDGRTDFANRELRLDPALGLPAIKDNLESRLILLRKRLEQKCPDVRFVPKCRGQFRLELAARVELTEKESG